MAGIIRLKENQRLQHQNPGGIVGSGQGRLMGDAISGVGQGIVNLGAQVAKFEFKRDEATRKLIETQYATELENRLQLAEHKLAMEQDDGKDDGEFLRQTYESVQFDLKTKYKDRYQYNFDGIGLGILNNFQGRVLKNSRAKYLDYVNKETTNLVSQHNDKVLRNPDSLKSALPKVLGSFRSLSKSLDVPEINRQRQESQIVSKLLRSQIDGYLQQNEFKKARSVIMNPVKIPVPGGARGDAMGKTKDTFFFDEKESRSEIDRINRLETKYESDKLASAAKLRTMLSKQLKSQQQVTAGSLYTKIEALKETDRLNSPEAQRIKADLEHQMTIGGVTYTQFTGLKTLFNKSKTHISKKESAVVLHKFASRLNEGDLSNLADEVLKSGEMLPEDKKPLLNKISGWMNKSQNIDRDARKLGDATFKNAYGVLSAMAVDRSVFGSIAQDMGETDFSLLQAQIKMEMYDRFMNHKNPGTQEAANDAYNEIKLKHFKGLKGLGINPDTNQLYTPSTSTFDEVKKLYMQKIRDAKTPEAKDKLINTLEILKKDFEIPKKEEKSGR